MTEYVARSRIIASVEINSVDHHVEACPRLPFGYHVEVPPSYMRVAIHLYEGIDVLVNDLFGFSGIENQVWADQLPPLDKSTWS